MSTSPSPSLPPEAVDALVKALREATQLVAKLESQAHTSSAPRTRKPKTPKPPKPTYRHYDSHHPSQEEDMWTTDPDAVGPHTVQLDNPARVVYCAYHKTQHKLSECIYVTHTLGGTHWVCREAARIFGWPELVIK